MRGSWFNRAARPALIVAAGLVVLAPVAALAAAETPNEVAEVIVTAQKRAEKINDVPESITAVAGDKLDVIRSSGGDIRVLSAGSPAWCWNPASAAPSPGPISAAWAYGFRPQRLAAGLLRL